MSGFYKMLEIVMKLSRKLNYFKVHSLQYTAKNFTTNLTINQVAASLLKSGLLQLVVVVVPSLFYEGNT